MEVLNDGPAPLISAMRRSIGLTSTINQVLDWDERQCKLSRHYTPWFEPPGSLKFEDR